MRHCFFFYIVVACLAFNLAAVSAFSAQVQITNISDLTLGPWGMTDPAISSAMDVCIYANSTAPVGSYAITITSTNGGFYIANGSRHIPYALYWEATGAGNLGTGSPGTLLTYGSKITGLANANTNSLNPTCTAGIAPTARLTLKITQADMQSALAGTYTDQINITLSPT